MRIAAKDTHQQHQEVAVFEIFIGNTGILRNEERDDASGREGHDGCLVAVEEFVRIRTENYYDEKIRFRNGMPVTTKKDKRLHGYGMKSICATVEKYGGSTVACQRDNWFELKILIPMKR